MGRFSQGEKRRPAFRGGVRRMAGMSWNDFGTGRSVDAAGFLQAAHTLLESAVAAAGGVDGPDAVRRDMIAGLEASLRTTGPYATLRLDTGPADEGVRRELADNTARVSSLVTGLVRNAAAAGSPPTRRVDVRSSCVGYTWIPAVVDRLATGAELHAARTLYNEWLWQLVLLRDALVPFVDAGAVRIGVDADGLTRLRDARDRFTVTLMTRRIAHSALVGFAADVIVGEHVDGAYGFQHDGTLVLPPVALRGVAPAPAYLLGAAAVRLVPDDVVFFVPAAPGELSSRASTPPPVSLTADEVRLVPGDRTPDGTRTVTLVVGSDGDGWDLGRVLRGHRHGARPPRTAPADDQAG